MDLTPVSGLIDQLKVWRTTEAAAAQDVTEAQEALIIADLRLSKAKESHRLVKCKVNSIAKELEQAVVEATEPEPGMFSVTG